MGRHYSDNYVVARQFFLAYIRKHEEFHKNDLYTALIKVHDQVSKNIFDTVFKTFVDDHRIFQ